MGNNIKNNDESPGSVLPIRTMDESKTIFKRLFEQSGCKTQGDFFTKLLAEYISNNDQNEREKVLSFANEISLISNGLDDILMIIKRMATKAQDSIGSERSVAIEKEKELTTQNEILLAQINHLKSNNLTLEKQNVLLESANNGFESQKEKLNNIIEKQKGDISTLEISLKDEKLKGSDYLNEINSLRKLERENLVLKSDLERSEKETKALQTKLNASSIEIDSLKSSLNTCKDALETVNESFSAELDKIKRLAYEEAKANLTKEFEMEKKNINIDWQEKFNALQADYNSLESKYNELQTKLNKEKNSKQ